MKRLLPFLAISTVLAGCAGDSARISSSPLPKPIVAEAAEPVPVKMAVLDWKGGLISAQDPSNSEYVGQTVPVPEMPLRPLGKGFLSGTVFVLDPGHGGKDPGCYWVENVDGQFRAFWESAYSYAMTYTLARRLREEGAIVYLTAHSDLAEKAAANPGAAVDPLPVPRDATLIWNRQSVQQGKDGWWGRMHMANDVYRRYKKTHKVVMLSVHVDSMPSEGWKGSHILVKDKNNPPKVATALAKKIKQGGYARTRDGQPKPVIDRTRDLFIFRKTENPQTILWEIGLPQDKDDSWRIRDHETREEFAEVMVESAIDYATQ